ncbi:hypothetical protein R3P38DRAFT_2758970 [Favolaschia claudopus]|uniref:Uncharacterized protein n=1 Tax=Favolaschia claudopus TaxID=2862362 RepID=A0AAW0E6G0_9AGAR
MSTNGVSSKSAILVLLNPSQDDTKAFLQLQALIVRPTDIQQCPPDPCPPQPIAPSAIPAGFGSVTSAAAPIASMAPSVVPAFVTDAYAPAQTGFAPPSGQSYAATGRVEIPQALNPVYGDGQKTFSSPPQLLAVCNSYPRMRTRELMSCLRTNPPGGLGQLHARNSVVPSPLREVINTSAVNAAPDSPSIADIIAAVLRSACANPFEDITSILADTDDEESSDTIIDLDTVTAPVSLPSFGFGIPTIVVVSAVTVQAHGMHDGNAGVEKKGGRGDTADEVVQNEILDDSKSSANLDDSAPTRRQTVETTPIRFNVDGATTKIASKSKVPPFDVEPV